MNNHLLALPLALSLALAAPAAQALGLGQLQVKSGLNQPLVAEIPIISATPDELDQLQVRLASPDAFARVGLDLPRELTANLQFSVGRNARGMPVIRVSTPNKFTEPFLTFLIEADWGKGTATREYTALIDPPYIAPAIIRPLETATVASAPPPPPAPVAAPVAPPAPAPEPAPTPPQPGETLTMGEPEPAQPQPYFAAPPPQPVAPTPPPPQPVAAPPPSRRLPKPVAAAPRPAPPPPPEPVAPPPPKQGQIGPVAAGQTLWSIADAARPDASITVNQMMLAMLRANPEAFDQDNINRLKRGSVLRIPSREEAGSLGPAEAAALVQVQAQAWRAPRAAVPQPAETTAERPAATASAAKPAPATRTARNTPRSRLEIVPPAGKASARGSQSGAAAGAGGAELRAELVQAKEDLAARTAEVTELKSRVTDLEAINRKQQEMIQVQSSEMKALQDRLEQLQADSAAAAVPAAPASVSVAVPATPPSQLTAPPAKVEPAPMEAPVAEAAPWYFNPYVLGGGALLLLGGLVFALRRGRGNGNSEEAALTRRISDDDALRASLANTRAAPVTDDAGRKPAPNAATPAKDEAGDPELESLQAAVKSRPQDLEAHLSLLRYHHACKRSSDYEAAAQAMRLHVTSTMDPRWREAVVMGTALLPGHPLFSQAGWNAPNFGEGTATAAVSAPAKVAAPVPAPTPSPAAKPAPVAAPVPVPAPAAAPAMSPAAAKETAEETPADWDRLVAQAGPSAGAADPFDLDVPDPGLPVAPDIHRTEAEILAEDEASATRIELAKAYLDIGDLEGARSMLEEVLVDGGPAAKAEALRILNELG